MELHRIAELAKQDAGRKFHSIAHWLRPEALWEAFASLRKNAAAGVDGVTYAAYEEHVVENLRELHERLKGKTYRAQPLRRIYIPKEDGKSRPISIPALEDKIVQRATVALLNAIFEQDFLDCSYGFRSGRSAHQALDEVGRVLCTKPTEFVLELDICAYFDSIVRRSLRHPRPQLCNGRNCLSHRRSVGPGHSGSRRISGSLFPTDRAAKSYVSPRNASAQSIIVTRKDPNECSADRAESVDHYRDQA